MYDQRCGKLLRITAIDGSINLAKCDIGQSQQPRSPAHGRGRADVRVSPPWTLSMSTRPRSNLPIGGHIASTNDSCMSTKAGRS